MTLRTEPRLPEPDEIYAALLALYGDQEASEALRAASRLVLLLANHIGDAAVVLEAIEAAKAANHDGSEQLKRDPPAQKN